MATSNKKRMTAKRPISESTTHPSLPHDLLMSCIARVSILYYPTFSLVSKSLQDLIASAELYKTRSVLGHTDKCLYVCLRFPGDPNPRWFTLCRVPDCTKNTSSGNVLAPVPYPSSRSSSNLVAVGSKIYKVGGDVNSPPSSCVSVMDCWSHKWHQAPSMQVKRNSSAGVVLFDDKIYVAGGCHRNSVNWVEVFDLNTQSWSTVTSPRAETREGSGFRWIALGGKLFLFGDKSKKGGVYSLKEGIWNPVGTYFNIDVGEGGTYTPKGGDGYCVIDDVLFCSCCGVLCWYDCTVNDWNDLDIGVEVLPDFGLCAYSKIVDYDGKMVVFWGGYDGEKKKKIWCAQIAVEKRYGEETGEIEKIWGKVEWLDVVLTVPNSCHMSRMVVLSTTA